MHPIRALMSVSAAIALAAVGYADQNLTTNVTDCGYTISGLPDGSIAEVFTKTGAEILWTKPAGVTALRYLVVGGGGGGGDSTLENCGAGGGGAGGFTEGNLICESGDAMQVSVTVGIGGAIATSGGASSFSVGGQSVSVNGGGFGGAPKAKQLPPNVTNASAGGGNRINAGNEAKATCNEGIYGNNGGAGPGATNTAGSGGGGAGGVGEASASKIAGAGGAGKMSDITGEKRYYAGGGGGAQQQSSVACGGSGVGGNGAYYVNKAWVLATAGLDGTGSGGGGGYNGSPSGAGGSGVVIIRYTPSSGKEQVELPTLDVDSAVYSGGVQKPTVICDQEKCEIAWGEGDWTAVGSYVVTVSLKGSVEWVDQTTDPKELTFTITKAENAWTRLPALGSLIVPSGVGTTIDRGAAAFGEVSATYDEAALKQLDLGQYEIAFTVAETANYGGLTTNIAFVVRDSSIPVPGDPDTVPTAYTWTGAEMGFWYDSSKWTTETSPCYGYPNSGVAETASTAIFKDVVATVRGDALNAMTTYDLTMTGSQLTFAEGRFTVKNSMKTARSENASAITVEDGASLVFSAEKALDLTKAPSIVTVRGTLSSETRYLFAKGSGAGSTLDVDGGTVSVPDQLTANTYGSGEFMHTTVRNGGKIAVKNMVLGDGEVTDAAIEDSENIYFLGDVTLSNATISAGKYIYAFGNDKSLTVDGATTFTLSRLYVGCNRASAGLFVATNYSFVVKSPLELSQLNGQFYLGETGSKNVNFVIDNTTVTLDSHTEATVKPTAECSFIELKGNDAKLLMPKATLTVGEAGGAAQTSGFYFHLPVQPYASAPVLKMAGTGSGEMQLYGNAVIKLDVTEVLRRGKFPLVEDVRNAFAKGIEAAGSAETYLNMLQSNLKVVQMKDGVEVPADQAVTLSIEGNVLYATVKGRLGLSLLIR